MIYLKANAAGKTKREYVTAVVDDCKRIFNETFADHFFRDDNLKVAFCTFEDQASVFEAFCSRFFPLYLAEGYSRTDYFAAQAMTNVPEDICGILICLDTHDEGDVWYQIILHEMSHIFCIVNELGGENFQEKYSKENLERELQYHVMSVGYTIWKEFIADYIASQLNPFAKTHSLVSLRKVVSQLDEEVNFNHPDRAQAFSQILFYIFQSPRIMAAPDVNAVVQVLDKNHILPHKDRHQYYREVIELIFHQLDQELFWRINVGFIEELGEIYLKMLFCEAYGY